MGLKEAWQEGLVLREARPLPVPLPPHPPQFSCGTERGPLGEKPLCDLSARTRPGNQIHGSSAWRRAGGWGQLGAGQETLVCEGAQRAMPGTEPVNEGQRHEREQMRVGGGGKN